MTTRCYHIPGGFGVQETGQREYHIPGGFGVQETLANASGVTGTIASTEGADSCSSTGSNLTRSVSVTLVTSSTDSTPRASLTGLNAAFFDAMPWSAANTPSKVVTTTGTTDGSGVFTMNLPGASAANGATGYLIITDSDGTTAGTPKAFAAPVTVTVQ